MKVGVSTASLYPMHTEDALAALANHGVKYIELFLNSRTELEGPIYQKMLSCIRDSSIQPISFHPFSSPMESVYLFSSYDRRVEEILDLYKSFFHAMNQIGATIFVLHGAISSAKCSNEYYLEKYLKLYRIGKEFGITVAQENISYCKSGKVDFLHFMSKQLGEEVAFVIDLKQARRSNVDIYDLLDIVGDKTVHYHVSDCYGEKDCLPIGLGCFDFKEFINKLKSKKYDGGLMIELYRENYQTIEELISCYHYFSNLVNSTLTDI
jgi:sugar phosphate isomerase/epimerase